MSYIDHFSENSKDYLHYRPTYPNELYVYLTSLIQDKELAWDAGTGNGQAAFALAEYFNKVIATDINQAQLETALKKNNIDYQVSSSEKTNLLAASIDLITIAQALHWFKLDAFYDEVKRVGKPTSIIAAWCYGLGSINDEVDVVIKKLYAEILGDNYWPKERKWIEQKYQTIPFPFSKLNTPSFMIEKELNFNEFLGYLNTWSAVKEYKKQNQKNPIDLVYQDLLKVWESITFVRTMSWPIYLLVGSVHEKTIKNKDKSK